MSHFNRENQDKIFINNLPKGRANKQAKINGTEYNKIIKWVGNIFAFLIDEFNAVFDGIFICKSTRFIENFKKDFGIPNEIFYETTVDEHQKDIKVLKYLMKGNIDWNFKAIASMYDICIEVKTGVQHFEESQLPAKIPYRLYSNFTNANNILVITIYSIQPTGLPYKLPLKLGGGLKIDKMKKIYDKIKPAHTSILYISETDATKQCEKITIC